MHCMKSQWERRYLVHIHGFLNNNNSEYHDSNKRNWNLKWNANLYPKLWHFLCPWGIRFLGDGGVGGSNAPSAVTFFRTVWGETPTSGPGKKYIKKSRAKSKFVIIILQNFQNNFRSAYTDFSYISVFLAYLKVCLN